MPVFSSGRPGLLTPIQTAKKTMDLFEDLESHLPLHTHSSTEQRSKVPVFSGLDDGGAAHVESLCAASDADLRGDQILAGKI